MNASKKIIIACVCSLFLSGGVFSQVSDFKLSDYKYRTPLYQSLQLDLDLSQGSTHSDNQKGINANLEAFISHLRVYATDARQHITLSSVYLQPRFTSSKRDDVKTIDNGLSGGVRYSTQDRRFKPGYFIETGWSVGGNSTNTKSGQKGQTIGNGQHHTYLELTAGIGKGRLEYVHDAQAAMLMLEELYSAGILKSRVSAETVNRFAQLITNVKRQRVLDARRRTVFRLTQVDSFLRANNITAQCDARTMAIINDIMFYSFQNDLSGNVNSFESQVEFDWMRANYDEGYERTDYGLIPQFEPITDQAFRQHGTVMYARLIPELRYNRFTTKIERGTRGDTVNKSFFLYAVPGIELGYEKHRALSLKWQKNYRAILRFAHTNYLRSKPDEIINDSRAQLDLDYQIGYYPNSRSVIEATGELDIDHFRSKISKSTFITPGLSLSAGYFVSYNTVLRASFNANYSIQKGDRNESQMTQGLRIYLRHYFF